MDNNRNRHTNRRQSPLSAIRLLILLPVLLSAGCDKAMKSYEDGVDLLARNRYDEAIGKLDLALEQCRQKRNRDCSMFEEKLTHARHIAAEHYYGIAETDLIATRLNDAKRNISRAIGYEPANPAYIKLREIILEQTLAAESLHREAIDYAGRQQWDAAIEAMQKAIAQYRNMPGAQSQLDKIRKDAYNFHLAAARRLFETDQWDQAVVASKKALQYFPGGREAKDIIAQIANRRKALELIEQAMNLIAENADPRAVLDTLERARRLYSSHPEIDALVHKAKQAVCDVKIAQANDAISAGRFHEALRLLNDSNRLLRNYGNVNSTIADVTQRIAQLHTDTGDVFRNEQKFGNAALHYIVAMNYKDRFSPARSGLAESISQLRESVKYSIGYVGFNCSWQDRKAADTIETALLQHIYKTRPANILIKDSLGFKKALSGINANIAEVDVIDVRIENVRPRNTDALIVGQVLNKDFVVAEDIAYARSKYQSGTKVKPNPDYNKARLRADALFHDREDATSQLKVVKIRALKMMQPKEGDNAHSLGERVRKARKMVAATEKHLEEICVALKKAKVRLRHIPPHIAIPVISEYRYPIVRVTRTARISAFIKVVDCRTAAVLMAESVNGSHSVSDTYITPDLAHNVGGDALELPQDDYIMKKATDQITGKLYGLCDSYLANHSKRFVAMMRREQSDGHEELAVEDAMRYLITPRNGGADRSKTIAFLKTVTAKRNENNAPDLNRLLAKYYKP